MFGLFRRPNPQIGTFTLKVYQPDVSEVSVEYVGERLSKREQLWLRGLYTSKSLFTLGRSEASFAVLASIGAFCRRLDEEKSVQIGQACGVSLVPEGRDLVARSKSLEIKVLRGPKFPLPVIDTPLPSDITHGDVAASIVAFAESWLRDTKTSADGFSATSFLQFWGGFLSFYMPDPEAILDPQSIIKAAFKSLTFAEANALGVMGLVEEED